ncbi:MAG: Na+/H+ antiporter NhaC family protein [Gemmatimonadetes bacterium]|nr:Na+/H+ antiporter NhaC family protein [Gemmatimonadota bacterium]
MIRFGSLAAALSMLLAVPAAFAQEAVAPVLPQVDQPAAVLAGNAFDIIVQLPEDAAPLPYSLRSARGELLATDTLRPGETKIERVVVRSGEELPLVLATPGADTRIRARFLPGWLSLVPPLLAIAFALIFREVVISLFGGIWLGALLLAGFNPITATLSSVDRFALGALTQDADRVAIVMFSLLLGGMVGVMTRSGGTQGIVEVLRPLATSARRGQFMTWLAGLIIFFDDYANTLIVGNTMRPVTDRLRVSREKLAYIVDSTAAPMAAIAAISTWVGFEISLIGSALESAAAQAMDPVVAANLRAGAENPFNVFIHSIPYLFYPILALLFVLMIVVTGRDFGPMLTAERRAATGGGLLRPGATPAADPSATVPEPPEGKSRRWYNAVLPVLTVIAVALLGIYNTGLASLGPGDHAIWDVMGAGDPFRALLWASFSGCLVAIILAVAQRILNPKEAIEAWVGGLRAMLMAIVILVLAWGLGGVTEALGTGGYLAELLGDALPLPALPALVFVIAAATSFATGTSWGTMAILFPVVIPLAVAMGAGVGFDGGEHYTILLGAISSIMAGSIFGDHCSPISDTTVLSSMASSCDHIDHVRTQLPYAVAVALVGMAVGDIPSAFGLHPAISLTLGAVILYAIVRLLGKPVASEGVPPRRVVMNEAAAGGRVREV